MREGTVSPPRGARARRGPGRGGRGSWPRGRASAAGRRSARPPAPAAARPAARPESRRPRSGAPRSRRCAGRAGRRDRSRALDLLGLRHEDRSGSRAVAVVPADLARVGDRVEARTKSRAELRSSRRDQSAGQLREVREVDEALGGLRAGCEQTVTAQAHPFDQPPHEDIGPHLLERVGGGAVEAQEGLDPVARLGRQLVGSRARPRARRPCRACAGARSWSSRRGRPTAARPEAG